MSEYSKTVTASGAALLSELSQRVTQVQALVQQHVVERSLSKVHTKFAQLILAAPSAVGSNNEVQSLLSVVTDEIAQLMSAIQLLQCWIQLHVPKVEDGNNFGVEVQKYAFVHLKESLEKWQKIWDSLSDYSSTRATAEGDEEKIVTAKVEKQSNAGSQAAEDAIAAVVALDVKWYFNLVRALEGVRDQYAVTEDVITKNKDKIELPRGKNDRAGFNMF
ncbi:unnamed protein product [Peronospora farinosa]|uniref:Proteasome activator PA28 C-terminal domain-containing protein n=1 Tax=Peronospora farinosa TaxID=134698 RepID=A0ABN8C0C1_9STRA|nr:unnamed protein product [Peronospora farinosa]